MLFLTEDAILPCKHENGVSKNVPSQNWVTIASRRVLVEPDPEGRAIVGCPNYGATIKPCTSTLKVTEGYSSFIRIGGKPVCLDTVTGLTDGTPPGIVKYKVRLAGQQIITEAK